MSAIRMKGVISGFLCLGLLAATAAAEQPLRLRLRHDNPVAVVPVKKAAAVRAHVTSSYDRDDSLDETALIGAAEAARIAELRKHTRRRRPRDGRRSPCPGRRWVRYGRVLDCGDGRGRRRPRVWKKKFAKHGPRAFAPKPSRGPWFSSVGSSSPTAPTGAGVSPVSSGRAGSTHA